jgi:uncharacterized protein YbjT (DUF2867 family)
MAAPIDTLVTVFGGSGFVGRHVVRALAKREYRIRVAVRRPELAGHLQPLGRVGQINIVQANLRHPASIKAAMRDASIVINLVGILTESGAQTFDAVQARGCRRGRAGCRRDRRADGAFSAIGADADSESAYARAKAAGEQAVLAAVPSATILRPSIVFGPEDQFTNRFANLARMAPVMPVFGATTKMQPVYVGDVAQAAADAVDGKTRPGATYELGGPEVLTMSEIIDIILATIERKRMTAAGADGHRQASVLFPAICPGRLQADAGSGHHAWCRQCGVGSRQGGRSNAGWLGYCR